VTLFEISKQEREISSNILSLFFRAIRHFCKIAGIFLYYKVTSKRERYVYKKEFNNRALLDVGVHIFGQRFTHFLVSHPFFPTVYYYFD